MNNDFVKYVMNKRAEGMSDGQIAKSLGMSLKHFVAACNENDKATNKTNTSNKVTPPTVPPVVHQKSNETSKTNKEEDTKLKSTDETSNDYNWMD